MKLINIWRICGLARPQNRSSKSLSLDLMNSASHTLTVYVAIFLFFTHIFYSFTFIHVIVSVDSYTERLLFSNQKTYSEHLNNSCAIKFQFEVHCLIFENIFLFESKCRFDFIYYVSISIRLKWRFCLLFNLIVKSTNCILINRKLFFILHSW